MAALKFLLLTGLRKEEALQARWEHVDLERGTLFLPHTKSGKSRTAILNDHALAVLVAQPRRPDHPYVFPGRVPGQPLNNPIKGFRRILTRRPGKLIVAELPPDLGGVIPRVSCVSVHDRQVRIGIDCPRAWSLHPGELVGERLRFPSRPRTTQRRGPSRAAHPR